MKKKLLAVVLSVVMLAALMVPMFAISAAATPTAKIGLSNIRKTTRIGVDGNPSDVIAIDINISDNTGYFFVGIYQLVSDNSLAPYSSKSGRNEVKGFDNGTFKSGDVGLAYTVTPNPAEITETGKTGFKVVMDSTVGTMGIDTTSGYLGTAYFVAPTEPGTYTFRLLGLDVADDGYIDDNTQPVPRTYNITVDPATATYKIESTCAHPGEKKDTVNSVAAKCGVGGTDIFVCTECGEELRRVPTDALEHEWDNGTTATNVPCGSTADIHYECTRDGCDETKDVTGAVVNHDWKLDEAASTPAKCGVAGENVFVCQNANCPLQTKTEPVAALEHNWDEGTPVGNVACGETADVIYHCQNANCPNPERTETGAVVEHNFVRDPAHDVAAKCGVPGSEAYKCDRANCPGGEGSTKTVPTAALQHNWVKDEAASTPAKCGVAGEDVFVCQHANCPVGTKAEPTKALEHDWVYSEELSEEPKCGVAGKDVYVCGNANCPVGTKETPIDALEHDYDYDYYDDMTVTKAPTADEVGKATIPCFHGCGATKEVDLDKLTNKVGDNESYISSKDAILPEDVNISINKGDEKDGKVEVEFTFDSNIVDNLEGDVEYVLDLKEAKKDYTNFKAYKVNADGTRTLVSEIKGDQLIISANLKDTLVLTYEEIEDVKSPVTGDSMNVTVFAVIALLAVAGLAVIGKKRFAL